MRLSSMFAAFAALAMGPAAAQAEDAAPDAGKTAPAYIPFANHGGVRDWQAEDKDTIYFQDRQRRWYRAELFSPSFDLPFTLFVGIDAEPGDRLDRFSSIYIRDRRYALKSFERIEGKPPRKVKKPKAEAAG